MADVVSHVVESYVMQEESHTNSLLCMLLCFKTRYCKYVNRLVAVSGGGEHCVLATVVSLKRSSAFPTDDDCL